MRFVVAVLVVLAIIAGVLICVLDLSSASGSRTESDATSTAQRQESGATDAGPNPIVDAATRASGIRDAVLPEAAAVDAAGGATLTVRLTHADGMPVRGGSLRLVTRLDRGEIAETVDLAADGCWSGRPERDIDRIDHLGTKAFATEWFGFVDGTTPLAPPFRLERESRDVSVVVDEGIVIQGVVVDAASGSPIDGVTVTLPRLERTFVTPTATTAQDGRFRIAGFGRDAAPDPTQWLVAARHDAHVPRDVFANVRDGGPTFELRIELDRGLSVSGVVTDGDGVPVRDASLELVAGRREGRDGIRWFALEHARSEVNGKFSFARVESADVVRIDAHAPGVVIPSITEAVERRSQVEVTLRGERATRLRVRAVDSTGAELAEKQAFVRHDDGRLTVPVEGPSGREFALRAGISVDVIVFGRVTVTTPWLRGEQRVLVPAEPTTVDVVAEACDVVSLEPPGNDVTWMRWNGIAKFSAGPWVFGSTLDLTMTRADGSPFLGTIAMRLDGGSFRGEVDGRVWISCPPGEHRVLVRGDQCKPVVLDFVGEEGGVIERVVRFERE